MVDSVQAPATFSALMSLCEVVDGAMQYYAAPALEIPELELPLSIGKARTYEEREASGMGRFHYDANARRAVMPTSLWSRNLGREQGTLRRGRDGALVYTHLHEGAITALLTPQNDIQAVASEKGGKIRISLENAGDPAYLVFGARWPDAVSYEGAAPGELFPVPTYFFEILPK